MLSFFRAAAAVVRPAARSNLGFALSALALLSVSHPAAAMNIQQIKSPGGI